MTGWRRTPTGVSTKVCVKQRIKQLGLAPNTSLSGSTSMPSMDDMPEVSDEQADLLAQQAAGLSVHDTDAADVPDMDDIPDMDDDIGGCGIKEVEDPAAQAAEVQAQSQAISTFAGSSSTNFVQMRTYDCIITYDKYVCPWSLIILHTSLHFCSTKRHACGCLAMTKQRNRCRLRSSSKTFPQTMRRRQSLLKRSQTFRMSKWQRFIHASMPTS